MQSTSCSPSAWLLDRQHPSNQLSSRRIPSPLDLTVASRNTTQCSGRTDQRPGPENTLPTKPWVSEKTLQPSISAETRRARRRSRSVENLSATGTASNYEDEHVIAPDSKPLQHADNDDPRIPRPRHNSVVANSKESTRLSAMYGWVTPNLPLEIAKGLSIPTQSNRRPRPNSVSPAELSMYSNFMQRNSSKDRLTTDNSNSAFSTRPNSWAMLDEIYLASPEIAPETFISPLTLGLPSYMDNLAKWDPPSYSDRRSSVDSNISKNERWGNIFGRRQKSSSTDSTSRNRRASSPSFLGPAPTMKLKQRSPTPPQQGDSLIQSSQGRNKAIDSGYLSFSSIDSNTSSVISALLARDPEDLDVQLESPPDSPRALHPCDLRPPTPEIDISVFDRLKENGAEVIQFADGIGEGVRSPNAKSDVSTELPLIMAATVEKLIEKLTKDIDHTFTTDFFLTFRQFMSPVKLCKLLILRFRWALHEDSEEHQLVRIRTFVVIRHWLTFYFAQDFLNLRTLRSMMSTFLSDMRSHPVILASQRDERIICSLLTVLKNQKKIYMKRKDGVATLESQHGGATQPSGSLRSGSANDQPSHKTVAGSVMNPNSSKDSIKVATHQTTSSKNPFVAMKQSMSTSSITKSSQPRRTPPATPQRSVRESNTWSMKMTFGISSIKRKVPAVYNSIVNGKSGNGTDMVETGLRSDGCICGPDHIQASRSASALTSYAAKESRSGSIFRMKMGKNAGTTSVTSDFDDSASSVYFTDETSLREVSSLRPSFRIRKTSFTPSHKTSGSLISNFSISQKPISPNLNSSSSEMHINPLCPYFGAKSGRHSKRTMSADSVQQLTSTYSRSQLLSQISPLSPLQMSHRSVVLQYRSEIIAQQLCIVEQRLLRDVSWEELIELRWTKNKPEPSTSDVQSQNVVGSEKKRGVSALIERFDAVCQWVASEIVRTRSIDSRAKVIEKFIRIALKCYHQRNYSTLTQLLVGLQSPLVSRLQQTWRRVDNYELHVLHDLQDLVKPFKNWKNIRDAMRKACDEIVEVVAVEECLIKGPGRDSEEDVYTRLASQTGCEGKGCIPFLGVYLSDLVYNAELPSYVHPCVTSPMEIAPNDPLPTSPALSRDLVNFHKHRITASVIKHVLAFKILSVRYILEFNPTVFPLVEQIEYLNPTELREASLACE